MRKLPSALSNTTAGGRYLTEGEGPLTLRPDDTALDDGNKRIQRSQRRIKPDNECALTMSALSCRSCVATAAFPKRRLPAAPVCLRKRSRSSCVHLEKDSLLTRGEPVRGRVGQPSIPMALNPDAVYSVGLKIGRRSADLVLMDFVGGVRCRLRETYAYRCCLTRSWRLSKAGLSAA